MSVLNSILKKKKSRKLKDISVDEVSLVDRAATGEEFFIVKAADIPEVGDLIQTFCAADGDGEGVEKEAPSMEALKKAVELLQKYKPDFPTDVLKAIQTLAAAAGSKDVATDGDGGYGYPGASHVNLPGFKKPVKKSGENEKWSSFSLSQIGVQIPLRITKRWDREAEDLADPDEPIDERLGEPRPVKGLRKSLSGQEGDDDGAEEVKELWPSL